ncbi:MAG: carbohydrate kinase family protein [Patescibacteria group bacterium]|nr:carbohydrate kinase family protein [Patescibacteria group bacterium]
MFDVITFGSATCDILTELPSGAKENGESRKICFALGEKIFLGEPRFFSGGGGTNTACSFANFGLKTAYWGKVGNDLFGEAVINDLKRFKVSDKLLIKDRSYPTALSIILSSEEQRDRVILVHRGACHFLTKPEILGNKITAAPFAKWFYIAPLYGQSTDVLRPVVELAKNSNAKVAMNPSGEQIEKGGADFEAAVALSDVLLMNMEEAKHFTKIDANDDIIIMKKARDFCPGIVVITKGKEGALIGSQQDIWQAEADRAEFKEATGAGDAFASGFVAGLFLQNKIDYGIILGMANSAGCVSRAGAKNGLLAKKDLNNLPQVAIKKI